MSDDAQAKLDALVTRLSRQRIAEILTDLDVPPNVHEQVLALALDGVHFTVDDRGAPVAQKGGQNLDLFRRLERFVVANPHFARGGHVPDISGHGITDEIARGLAMEPTAHAEKSGGARLRLPPIPVSEMSTDMLLLVGLSEPAKASK